MDEEVKRVLMELFDALGFSDAEKEKALLDFKKKVAAEILRSAEDKLSKEQRDFAKQKNADPNDPRMKALQDALKNLYTVDEYRAKGRDILRKLLPLYVDYMAQDMSEEERMRLAGIVRKL